MSRKTFKTETGIYQKVGRIIQSARKKAKLNIAEIARRSKLAGGTIRNIEGGTGAASLGAIEAAVNSIPLLEMPDLFPDVEVQREELKAQILALRKELTEL